MVVNSTHLYAVCLYYLELLSGPFLERTKSISVCNTLGLVCLYSACFPQCFEMLYTYQKIITEFEQGTESGVGKMLSESRIQAWSVSVAKETADMWVTSASRVSVGDTDRTLGICTNSSLLESLLNLYLRVKLYVSETWWESEKVGILLWIPRNLLKMIP